MQKNINFQTKIVPGVVGEDIELKTTLVSRNITVMGRRTSVRLEPEMWLALREISDRENCTVHDVCTLIGLCKKPKSSLTASIRVFIMLYFRAATTDDGHKRAGHGDFDFMKKRARIGGQHLTFFSKKKKNYLAASKTPYEGNGLYRQQA
jgi:predicted DNA-binding ribbon-helix-helix protein